MVEMESPKRRPQKKAPKEGPDGIKYLPLIVCNRADVWGALDSVLCVRLLPQLGDPFLFDEVVVEFGQPVMIQKVDVLRPDSSKVSFFFSEIF